MKKNSILMFAFLMVIALGFQAAAAQFTIKIPKLPKIKKPKVEQPQTGSEQTNGSDQSSGENNNSDAKTKTAQNKLLQVTPSAVGKIYFSNKPFGATNEGSKTSFTTGEYIYGRLETSSGTLRDAFKFSPVTKENPSRKLIYNLHLYYVDTVYTTEGYREALAAVINNPFVILSDADLDKTYWNFDVLPEPAKATTGVYYSDTVQSVDEDAGPFGLYKYLKTSAEEKTYTIGIEFQKKTADFRGKEEPEEKWLTVEGRAMIDFRAADFAKIKADGEQIMADRDRISEKAFENTKNAVIANEPLPKEWTLKSSPLLPGLTESKLRALYQQYGAHYVPKQIIKFYADPYTSTTRKVVTNDLGIPVHRILDQWFTVFARVQFKDGEVSCFYQNFYAAEKYAGGGTYGNLILITQTRTDVSCAKLGVK